MRESFFQQHLPGMGYGLWFAVNSPLLSSFQSRDFGFVFYQLLLCPLRCPPIWSCGKVVTFPLGSLGMSAWAHHEPLLQAVLPASRDFDWPVMLLLAGGKSPPSIPTKWVTAWDGNSPWYQLWCWSSTPRTCSQSLPKHGKAGKTGIWQPGIQGRNWETIWSGWKQITPNTSLLSERNAAEGGYAFNNKITQLVLNKVLLLTALPCASLSLFRSLSFHSCKGSWRSTRCHTAGAQQVGQAWYRTSRDHSVSESWLKFPYYFCLGWRQMALH